MTVELVDILELLNNNVFFIKKYDAVIDDSYYTKKIKITHKKKLVSLNDTFIYNPKDFSEYSHNIPHVDKYCHFYLTILKTWFSTKIYINAMINPSYSIKFNKLEIKSYSASVYNLDVDCIHDYLFNIDYIINRESDIYNIVASNQHICRKCSNFVNVL